jgi:hypothetical protein
MCGLPPKVCEKKIMEQLATALKKGTNFKRTQAKCNTHVKGVIDGLKSTRAYIYFDEFCRLQVSIIHQLKDQ